jgi:hypothetical protein
LRFELFQTYTLETFAKACVGDVFDRFEVMSLPDLVNGEMREVWWARARDNQTIPVSFFIGLYGPIEFVVESYREYMHLTREL